MCDLARSQRREESDSGVLYLKFVGGVVPFVPHHVLEND